MATSTQPLSFPARRFHGTLVALALVLTCEPLGATEENPPTPLDTNTQKTIQSLAKHAEANLRVRHFTTRNGALEKYQKILTMDPNHPLAWEGMRKIVQAFQNLSNEAEQAGQPALAKMRAKKAQQVQALIDAHDQSGPTEKKIPIKKVKPPVKKPVQNKTETKEIPLKPPLPLPVAVAVSEAAPPVEEEKIAPPPESPKIPEATPKPVAKESNAFAPQIKIESVTGMEFIEIPEGCFKMGSDSNDPDEKPIHEVCLQKFWLGRTEVTNGQFRRFRAKHDSSSYDGLNLSGDLQPVVNITWEDANSFATWLSGRGAVTFRLPTEAEWEYAARAGSTTLFPWGDEIAEGCRYANIGDTTAKKVWPKWNVFPCSDGYAETAPVGMFLPNKFGLFDMIGNVWEWVSDWYSTTYYATSPKNDPKGPEEGRFRSARGGSWANWPDYARTANRTGIDPNNRDRHVGFRLIMVP
ncbi:MAG: formylglycine-generating enzyme family protein [Magnetococcales bacterium]|nr:formylglycine-generating enzyme family protein [Magnetococcales bacterium]